MSRKPVNRNYFTKETEEWVVKYNNCSDEKERNAIFKAHLYFPFYKLAENIINTYKFYNMDVDTIEDLKLDIITMIFQEKISKFNPDRGAKAFSYFGTVIKRWLIAYSNANYLRKKRHVSIDYYEDQIPEISTVEITPTLTLSGFLDNWIEETYRNLDTLFSKETDRQIADAVLTVFRSRRDLQIFKKKALYIFVREITGCDTPGLTKIIVRLRDLFYSKYTVFREQGLIQ